MKNFTDIELGYNDATNYRGNRKFKQMFNSIFVKGQNLDKLMREDTYFLIGDKGTGKTAYATFLENQEYKNTLSSVVDMNSTDYKIFMKLRQLNYLQLSDFARVWKIIILVLIAKTISRNEIELFGPKRSELFNELKNSISNYYGNAFVPEISSTFRYILDKTDANEIEANIGFSGIELSTKSSSDAKSSVEKNISKYQNNLLDLENKTCEAFHKLKISKNRFLLLTALTLDLRIFRLMIINYV